MKDEKPFPVIIKLDDNLQGSFKTSSVDTYIPAGQEGVTVLVELHGDMETGHVTQKDYVGRVLLSKSIEPGVVKVSLEEGAHLRYKKKVAVDFLRSVRGLHVVLLGGSYLYKAVVTHIPKGKHVDMLNGLAYKANVNVNKVTDKLLDSIGQVVTHPETAKVVKQLITNVSNVYRAGVGDLKYHAHDKGVGIMIRFDAKNIKAMDNCRMRLGISINRVADTFISNPENLLTLGAAEGSRSCSLYIQGSQEEVLNLLQAI